MKTLLRRSMALVLVSSLSGCAIVSPQLKPDVPVAGAWNEAPPADAAAVSPTWWTAFGSTELQSLVDEALAGSPDLAIATERVQQAEAQVRIAGASLFPVVSANAGTSGGGASKVGGAAGAGIVGTIANSAADANLTASYELDLWGRNRAGELGYGDRQVRGSTLTTVPRLLSSLGI